MVGGVVPFSTLLPTNKPYFFLVPRWMTSQVSGSHCPGGFLPFVLHLLARCKQRISLWIQCHKMRHLTSSWSLCKGTRFRPKDCRKEGLIWGAPMMYLVPMNVKMVNLRVRQYQFLATGPLLGSGNTGPLLGSGNTVYRIVSCIVYRVSYYRTLVFRGYWEMKGNRTSTPFARKWRIQSCFTEFFEESMKHEICSDKTWCPAGSRYPRVRCMAVTPCSFWVLLGYIRPSPQRKVSLWDRADYSKCERWVGKRDESK
jgi:hypothetical protein